ncbi:DUF5131 family protein [Gordonia sihwensis]|uniref:DUF5131 family protein n=1 Tax=Gordonia sihwensis TaxID=173559 RepID=UPI0005EDE640|nr:phage Gp37/Gp68 family protein [Gordonia sihwensis]KJR10284.1 hypothetical protein UG54_01525 [Gordonia sihwensis]
MGDKTRIEWADASWNPATGCDKVSPGCDHCYAETIAHRFAGGKAYPNGFDVTLRPERLGQPIRWKKPRRIFVCSMSDLFNKDIPDEFIAQVFAVMALSPQHTFEVLTKRHGRMRALLSSPKFLCAVEDAIPGLIAAHSPQSSWLGAWPLPNVWLGVSAENQRWADIRIPALLDTPAAVRWVSVEPLLGPIDLRLMNWSDPDEHCGGCSGLVSPKHEPACGVEPGPHWGLDWVVAGGESGPKARPMHPEWARTLRDQCRTAGVSFLFKQWGEWAPVPVASTTAGNETTGTGRTSAGDYLDITGCWRDTNDLTDSPIPDDWALLGKVGKKTAGRHLDGRNWDQYPDAAAHERRFVG